MNNLGSKQRVQIEAGTQQVRHAAEAIRTPVPSQRLGCHGILARAVTAGGTV